MKKVLFICLSMFIFIIPVQADSRCSLNEQLELNQLVNNIKISYETKQDIVQYTDMDAERIFFQIDILNITDDVYLKITNDFNNEEIIYNYADTEDGLITFNWFDIDSVVNFKVEVYSSVNSACPGELYRTISLKLPRYNYFYDYEICNDYKDFSLCQQFVFFNDIDEKDFNEQLNKYKASLNKEDTENKPNGNITNNYNSNLKVAFYTFLIIIAIVLIIIIIVKLLQVLKKKRKKNNYEKNI